MRGRGAAEINTVSGVGSIISLRSGSKRENEMSGEVVNFCFAGREIVTVYVLIMSTERDSKPETFMALTL